MGETEFMSLSIVPLSEVIIRILLALFLGFCLGLDRESKDKPIDFRAYMIVAMTTCVVAIMGQELYGDFQSTDSFIKLDIGKVISGTLTGLGFLGAGTIIKLEGNTVVGTATGASIWASGIIGLALGFGFYVLALLAFFGILLTLVLGGFFQGENKGTDE